MNATPYDLPIDWKEMKRVSVSVLIIDYIYSVLLSIVLID